MISWITTLPRKWRWAPRVDGKSLKLQATDGDGTEQIAGINADNLTNGRLAYWDTTSFQFKTVSITKAQAEFNSVTAGAGTASRTVVLDANKNVTGINQIGVTELFKATQLIRRKDVSTTYTIIDTENIYDYAPEVGVVGYDSGELDPNLSVIEWVAKRYGKLVIVSGKYTADSASRSAYQRLGGVVSPFVPNAAYRFLTSSENGEEFRNGVGYIGVGATDADKRGIWVRTGQSTAGGGSLIFSFSYFIA